MMFDSGAAAAARFRAIFCRVLFASPLCRSRTARVTHCLAFTSPIAFYEMATVDTRGLQLGNMRLTIVVQRLHKFSIKSL
jgi:hypothetical protein